MASLSGFLFQLNDTKKTSGEVPISSMKMVADLCYQEITHHMNKPIESCEFPDDGGTNKKKIPRLLVASERGTMLNMPSLD